MNTNIWGGFQIYISVPLNVVKRRKFFIETDTRKSHHMYIFHTNVGRAEQQSVNFI